MMENWSLLTRRLVALGLLAVSLLGIDTLLLAPWRDQRTAYQAQAAADRALTVRYLDALARLRARVDAIGQLRDNDNLKAAFLGPVAATQLQDMVKRAAADEGVDISSLQILPVRQDGNVRHQGLAVVLEAPFEKLVRMIFALENQQPLVRLSGLELERAGRGSTAMKIAFTAEGLVAEAKP